jgi:histone acetyltransferase (RNA polymerase elongator complex component)
MIIPFFIPHAGCPHQCVFCDQKSITGKNAPPDPSSISSTIESYLAAASSAVPAEVAFFGGTFTAMPIEEQRVYLVAVQPFIAAGRISGIRLSTRPDAVTPDILAMLKQHHVTTIELGAQSMDDEVLRLSGRGHTAAHTANTVSLLREHAFRIGIQLMPGLPGDTAERFHETIRTVISLRPAFVRLYPALVIRDTPLALLYRDGTYTPLSLDDAVDLCRSALELFGQAGIEVVRVGLQATDVLARPGTVLAGPWHPAFRQLVESSRFLESMRSLLSADGNGSGPAAFAVHPADLSSAIGQNRRNIHAIRDRFGRDATITADPSLPRGELRKTDPCKPSEAGL